MSKVDMLHQLYSWVTLRRRSPESNLTRVCPELHTKSAWRTCWWWAWWRCCHQRAPQKPIQSLRMNILDQSFKLPCIDFIRGKEGIRWSMIALGWSWKFVGHRSQPIKCIQMPVLRVEVTQVPHQVNSATEALVRWPPSVAAGPAGAAPAADAAAWQQPAAAGHLPGGAPRWWKLGWVWGMHLGGWGWRDGEGDGGWRMVVCTKMY